MRNPASTGARSLGHIKPQSLVALVKYSLGKLVVCCRGRNPETQNLALCNKTEETKCRPVFVAAWVCNLCYIFRLSELDPLVAELNQSSLSQLTLFLQPGL